MLVCSKHPGRDVPGVPPKNIVVLSRVGLNPSRLEDIVSCEYAKSLMMKII